MQSKKTPPPFSSFEVEETGQRFYSNGRSSYPSVTTILDGTLPASDHLKHFWMENGYVGQRVFKKIGQQGTNVHNFIDQLEAGGEIPATMLTNKEKKCLAGFLSWDKKYKDRKVVSAEGVIVSKKHKYAGRFDRLYEIDGELWLVDFKTGTKKDADKFQIAAYWTELQKQQSKTIKTVLLYLNSSSKQGFSMTETVPEEDIVTFLLARKMFDRLYPDPLSKLRQYPEIFKI